VFFSGISDEAGQAIDDQIKAHEELGWEYLELRLVDGIPILDLPLSKVIKIARQLKQAGITVSNLASKIGDWSRPITGDFSLDIIDLYAAAACMDILEMPERRIRVMSWPNDPKNPVSEADWRREAIRRMRELANIAGDLRITLAHENCSGYGGISVENNVALLEAMAAYSAFKVLFDTGNAPAHGKNSWKWYQAVRKDIGYVHIKDAKILDPDKPEIYTYPGDGDGYVEEIIQDLLTKGYDGGFSIEPHLAAVVHTGQKADSEEELYKSYVEYGRRLMALVAKIQTAH